MFFNTLQLETRESFSLFAWDFSDWTSAAFMLSSRRWFSLKTVPSLFLKHPIFFGMLLSWKRYIFYLISTSLVRWILYAPLCYSAFYQNSHLYRSTALYQIPALCQNTSLCWRTARFQKCSSLCGCFSLIETLSFSYFIHWCSYNSRSRKIAIKQYKKGWITERLWILSLLRLNFQLFEYFFYFLLTAFSIASLYYDVASEQFWILCSAF